MNKNLLLDNMINVKRLKTTRNGYDIIYRVHKETYVEFIVCPSDQGRIQEFWLGGRGFFFKDMGSGAALRPPVGPGQRPGGSPGGEAPGSS